MKELRAALETDRVDEQREKHCLDAWVDIHPDLSDDDAHQQGAGYAPEHEAADLYLADEIAERDGREQRQQRFGCEESVQEFHRPSPSSRSSLQCSAKIGRNR